MSISSMANLAYARRSDVAPMDVGLQNLSEVGAAKAPKPETVSTATSALEAIVAYIPTEVVTLYVAVLAALGVKVATEATPAAATATAVPATANAAAAGISPLWVYLAFLILTPIVTW